MTVKAHTLTKIWTTCIHQCCIYVRVGSIQAVSKRLKEKLVICNKTSKRKKPNICCKPSTYFWNIIRYYKKYIWEAKEPVMHSYFFFKWILFYHSTTHKKDSTKELTTSNNRLNFCIPWVLLPKIQNLINLCMLICI